IEAHRHASAFDDLPTQTDERRVELDKSEAELSKLKSDAGITSLDEVKTYAEQKAKIEERLYAAEADLAARRAALNELQNFSSTKSNQVASTGVTETAVSAEIPPEKKEDYKTIATYLETLH